MSGLHGWPLRESLFWWACLSGLQAVQFIVVGQLFFHAALIF